MFPRLVAPLTVLAFLAGTAFASDSNQNLHSQISSSASAHWQCAASGNGFDPLQSTVIGALSGRASAGQPNIVASLRPAGQPVMVAALEMAFAPAADNAPSTCYPPLSLATSSLPNGAAGAPYSVTLAANGGQPPYSWSLGQSQLPQGFSLDSSGNLTGTPSAAGTYTFNVVISDSLKDNVTGALTLSVAANGVPVTPPTNPDPPSNPAPPVTPPTNPTPPSNPAPPVTPPSGPATGTALSACGALTRSGTYYLSQDVSSAGTCFAIGADNITLNLNGHTITYGTGGGSAPTPAIADCAGWYTGLAKSQCVGGGGNLTVYGGTITQSANAAPFSPVFWMGQGDGAGGGAIYNLTTTFQSVGSQFFHGEIDGGGYTIQNNTINDNVTNIQHPGQPPLGARAQFQGYVIHTDQESTGSPKPDTISGNTINGSPQGGIADGVAGSQIYNNTIHLTSYYSNDYGVIVTMNNQNVHDNTITGRGRGMDAESSGFILNHNTINVAEEANNSEYSGCELDGTYGIRVKNYDWPNSTETGTSPSTNFQITNNSITVPTNVCQGTGITLTDMNLLVTGLISGNTFTVTPGAGGLAAALAVEGASGPNITFQGNTFTAPTCLLVGGDGDIPYGIFSVQSGQTWNCAAGPTVVTKDYSYGQAGSLPPIVTILDNIPNPSVSCGSYSTATVSVGSSFNTTCNRKGN